MIGFMKGDKRVVIPEIVHFFRDLVASAAHRTLSDFTYCARIARWTGDFEASIDFIDQAQTIFGRRWQITFQLASHSLDVGDLLSADRFSEETCALAPARSTAWRLRAAIEVASGGPRGRQFEVIGERLDRTATRLPRSIYSEAKGAMDFSTFDLSGFRRGRGAGSPCLALEHGFAVPIDRLSAGRNSPHGSSIFDGRTMRILIGGWA